MADITPDLAEYEYAREANPRLPGEGGGTYAIRLAGIVAAAVTARGRRETGEDKPKPAAPWAAPWDNR